MTIFIDPTFDPTGFLMIFGQRVRVLRADRRERPAKARLPVILVMLSRK